MSDPKLETNVTIDGFSRIDFDRKQIRKALNSIGRDVRKDARRLVARRVLSGAGDYPGSKTGALLRSIKHKVSRAGFMVVVRPTKTAEMGEDFYPAFLHYGSKKRNLAARKNFMTDALDNRQENARTVLRAALQDSLIPRK